MHLYYGIDYNIAKINKNMISSNSQQIILQIIISFGQVCNYAIHLIEHGYIKIL